MPFSGLKPNRPGASFVIVKEKASMKVFKGVFVQLSVAPQLEKDTTEQFCFLRRDEAVHATVDDQASPLMQPNVSCHVKGAPLTIGEEEDAVKGCIALAGTMRGETLSKNRWLNRHRNCWYLHLIFGFSI